MIPEEWKTKSELVQELSALRRRVAKFERALTDGRQASRNLRQKGDLIGERQSALANPRVAKLFTRTEMKVLCFILDGKSNKEIAYLLHRSVRTVEVHRSHIMRKFDVDNLVDLVKRAAAMGLVDLP